jgi:molecular chaperone Hsp33
LKNIAYRGISKAKSFRFFAVDCTDAVKEAVHYHSLSITNSVIMGRAMAAVLMLGLDLKNSQDAVTMKIDCDGVCGGLLVTGKADGTVKGYIRNPQAELPLSEKTHSVNVKEALGKGQITIIKDAGMKRSYVGTVELLFGEIAEDLTYYFAQSEQIPTSIGLGVFLEADGTVKHAGGFMIQLLPDTPQAAIDTIEKLISHFPNLTDLLDMGYSLKNIVETILLKKIPIEFLEERKVKYFCDCSKEKFSKGLKLLGKSELQEAIEKDENLHVVCHFCNKNYAYTKEDIARIMADI